MTQWCGALQIELGKCYHNCSSVMEWPVTQRANLEFSEAYCKGWCATLIFLNASRNSEIGTFYKLRNSPILLPTQGLHIVVKYTPTFVCGVLFRFGHEVNLSCLGWVPVLASQSAGDKTITPSQTQGSYYQDLFYLEEPGEITLIMLFHYYK